MTTLVAALVANTGFASNSRYEKPSITKDADVIVA
jgi:hypothetical protein